MILAAAAGATVEAGADAGPFTIRLVAPAPLYLAGRTTVAAEAVDEAGRPWTGVAYMTLALDGQSPRHDGQPPFSWEVEAGESLRRHRIELTAVARDGRRAALSLVSLAHPWVEAVDVRLVLVPVVVRETLPDGSPGRPVAGLARSDFTVLEDGAAQEITAFSADPLPASVAVAVDTSPSMEGHLWSVRRAVADFAREQPAWSALSLLTFNDQVYLEEEFTHDSGRIARSASILRAGGSRTALWETVRYGSRHLARRDGARALVLFTDGEDSLEEGSGEGRRRTAVESAQAADVAVFAVAWGRADRDAIEEVTRPTGGETIAARGAEELREAFRRIGESLGSRYVLGYAPPDPERPGERRIEVRVARPGLHLYSRTGYRLGSER